jgi:hypothetical protein
MNKEEILALLQGQILSLRDRSSDFPKNPQLVKDWTAKTQYLQQLYKTLNDIDREWLNIEYNKWFMKEIEPIAKNIDSLREKS